MCTFIRSLIQAIAVAVLLLGATAARAYCVYNDAADTVTAIGEKCPGCFKAEIKPGQHECCPGDKQGCRGTTWISWWAPSLRDLFAQGSPARSLIPGPCQVIDWKDLVIPGYRLEQQIAGKAKYGVYFCPHKVPEHGWVTIKGAKGDHCHVKDANGKVLYDGKAEVQCGIKDD